jgi:hypothetical protein
MGLRLFFSLWFVVAGLQLVNAQRFDKEIVGPLKRDTFLLDEELQQWFPKNYDDYRVKENQLPALKNALAGKSILVVIGTWCSDSREQFPALMKILDAAGFADNNLRVFGVDRDKKQPDYITGRYKITNVPTIIVMDYEGNETGRITETPEKSLEEDLSKF